MNLFFEYIKYRWIAKGRHGTHSPFVYDFVDQCLKIELDSTFKKERLVLFKKLKSNHKLITIKDFGVGSKKLSNSRKISQIFKNSSSKGKYGDMLFCLAQHYKPKRILEFGTSIGIGTIHLSKGNPESKITTVEACSETRKIALENFNEMNCVNINSIESTFADFLNSDINIQYDLVFIDGHHDGNALKHYMKELEKFTHNDTIFVLDDIRWSQSMLLAWETFVNSKNYHVTMDFFRMGIVIKRHQQEKENFIVSL